MVKPTPLSPTQRRFELSGDLNSATATTWHSLRQLGTAILLSPVILLGLLSKQDDIVGVNTDAGILRNVWDETPTRIDVADGGDLSTDLG